MPDPARRSAFTVVEVFLVITLLAIVAALMVVPVQRLVEALQVRPVRETVQSVVRTAHLEARKRNETVLMMYHSNSNILELCTAGGTCIEQIPLVPADAVGAADPVLELHYLVPEDPEGEAAAYENGEETVDTIAFHPAGASTPFAVDFVSGSEPMRLVMDPFSGAAVLCETEDAVRGVGQ